MEYEKVSVSRTNREGGGGGGSTDGAGDMVPEGGREVQMEPCEGMLSLQQGVRIDDSALK